MNFRDFTALLERTAPLSIAAPWDNSGVQVASTKEEISHVAMMLDPTPAAIGSAIQRGADCILAHHPLSMKPRLPNQRDDFHEVLRLLFIHDIPLYSAHTSLDANLHGPAAWLADAFALQECKALEKTADCEHGEPHYGFGITGVLPSALPYAEFIRQLACHTGKTAWRSCGPKPERVSKLAYCPGSGESLLPYAVAAEVEVYITGDMKYHAALEASVQVIDIGHFILEEIMMRRFCEQLRSAGQPITISYIDSSDPFTFESIA